MNRVGDRGFKMVAKYWMRDQEKKGEGLQIYEMGVPTRNHKKSPLAASQTINAEEKEVRRRAI